MIYLNHNAGSYPKPQTVQQAVAQQLNAPPPSLGRGSSQQSDIRKTCRKTVAQFFNTTNPVIFTSGSTEALNLVLFGLDTPKHIISTVTEHNSVIRPLKVLERDQNVQLTWVPCDTFGYIDIDTIKNAIRQNTTAIVVNHCSNVTGAIQNLDALSQLAQEVQIPLIVDASQSAGTVPIDLTATPVDALIFTGYKSLFAYAGIGGLVLHPKLALRPLKVGGTGFSSDLLYQPTKLPTYYEAGTPNTLGLVSLNAGIKYIQKVGINAITKQKQALAQQLYEQLKQIPIIEWMGLTPNHQPISVLNFRIKGMSNADVAYILTEIYNIQCRQGLHCAPLIHSYIHSYNDGTIRLSFSHFNTIDEVKTVGDALLEITKSVYQNV